MPVAGDKEICPSSDGSRDHVIIVGVAGHHTRRQDRRHDEGQVTVKSDCVLDRNVALSKPRGEVVAHEYLMQFIQ